MAEDPSMDHPEEFEEPKYLVRVTGFSTNTTQDALLNFFENTRRSGGGDIKDIQCSYDEGFADIIFWSNNDAERVVNKKGLQLDDAILTTTLKPIPKELPNDHKRLHVMGISEKTIRDGLVAFMEVMSGKEIESILFGDNCSCVVSFKEPIDFDELQRICKTSSLDDSFLDVEEVIVCDSIEVSGFTENTTKDTILYYFRNNRNGGGDIKSIEIIAEGRVLLSFEDPRVIDNLLKQVHVIDGVHLVTSRYYPFLGETSENPKGEKRERVVQVDPQTIMFIEEFCHQEFDQLLKESQIKYTWQQGSGEILLGCAELKLDKKTWENSCEAVVSYVNQFVTDKISISQEISWEEMSDEVTEKCVGLETQIQILHVFDFSKKQDSIIVRGKKTNVCALLKELYDLVARVEKQIMFEKSKVIKKIDLSEVQMELMSLCGFVEDLKSKYKDLEIMDSGDHTIQMRGQEDVVNEGNLAVWQTLAELKETELKLDKSVIEILASEDGKEFLSTMLKNNNIDAVVCPDSKLTELNLVVTAVDRDNMKKALSLIHDVTAEEIFPLDIDQKQLMDSEKWRELKESIQQSMLLKITEESAENKLSLFGIRQEIDNAKEEIEEFFKKNVIMKNVEAEAESAIINDINEPSMKKDPVEVLEKRDEEEGDSGKWILYGTDIDTDTDADTDPDMDVDSDEILSDGNEDRVKVEGKPEGGDILSTQDELLMHRDSVGDNVNSTKEEQCPEAVTMPYDSFDLKDLQENDLFQLDTKVTQRTEELSVMNEDEHNPIYGKEDEVPQIPMSNTESQSAMLPLSETLENGVVVSVHQGDITKVQVGVIVNSTNESLLHGGGVAGAIVKQGGRQIQQESDALVRRYGRVPVGKVAHTGPGNLPYKRIFHAVGPQWKVHGEERSRQLIFDACMNSFNLASKQRISSIALPGISSGIYGVPKQICAEMMFTAAEMFSAEASSDNQLKDIRFVNIDNPTYEAFRREFHKRYDLMKGEYADLGSNPYNDNAVHLSPEAVKEREYQRHTYQQLGSTARTGQVDAVEESKRRKVVRAKHRRMEKRKQ